MSSTPKPHSGSGSLSRPGSSPTGSLTSEASLKSAQMTFEGMTNATSSPGSADGATPCASRASKGRRASGAEAAPASPSATPERALAQPTSATCGLPGSGLFRSAADSASALGSSLASRLRAKLPLGGSMEYALTWKERATPAGRLIFALRASARPTSDSVSTGWPTVLAEDGTKGRDNLAKSKARGAGNLNIPSTAALAGWTTPAATNGKAGNHYTENMTGKTLTMDASLAGWPTPMAGSPGTEDYNPAGNTDSSRKTVALVGWNTPRATDGSNGGPNQSGGALPADAALTRERERDEPHGWCTPSARDWKDTPGMKTTETNPDGSSRNRVDQLPRQAQLASGAPATSSSAPTEKRGALNPRFSLWLMGYPEEWASCGERAMLSIRSKPRASSKRAGKK